MSFAPVSLQTTLEDLVALVPTQVWLAVVVFAIGVVLGYLAMLAAKRLLVRLDVPDEIEGTTFERAAQDVFRHARPQITAEPVQDVFVEIRGFAQMQNRDLLHHGMSFLTPTLELLSQPCLSNR